MTNEELLLIKNEINNDPTNLGYAGKTNQEIVELGNTKNTTVDRLDYTPAQIVECYPQLNIPEGQLEILQMDVTQSNYIDAMRVECKQFQHSPISLQRLRDVVPYIFFDKPIFLANLLALTYKQVSRWEYIGVGNVNSGDIQNAKNL